MAFVCLCYLVFNFRFKNKLNLQQTNALCRNVLVSVAFPKRICIRMKPCQHHLLFVSLSPSLGRHFLVLSGHLLGAPVVFRGCPWDGWRNWDLRPGSCVSGAGGFIPAPSSLHVHVCMFIFMRVHAFWFPLFVVFLRVC
jgi:hypothetical protein